jgi:hypothetical protein
VFATGSFANGGAMRICPLGIAFRNATATEMYAAVEEAVMSTHVHPEAVDGAFCVAMAVGQAMQTDTALDIPALIRNTLLPTCQSPRMRDRLAAVLAELADTKSDRAAAAVISDETFQISAVNAVALVLFMAARYISDPATAVARSISLGGDTDTLACMVGGIMGALHGTAWLRPDWLSELENGARGRDYAAGVARQLAALDCHVAIPPAQFTTALLADPAAIAEVTRAVCEARDRWLAAHGSDAAAAAAEPVPTRTVESDWASAASYPELCRRLYGLVRARFGRFLPCTLVCAALLEPLLVGHSSADVASFGRFLAPYVNIDAPIQFKRKCLGQDKWNEIVRWALEPPAASESEYSSFVMDYEEWRARQ